MSESKSRFGQRIEGGARIWLESRFPGLRFLMRNYRWKGGELDLVFEDRSGSGSPELVFVEVRARLEGSWIDGVESVTFPKQLRLSRTIRHFLSRYRGPCKSVRLDIVAWDGKVWLHLKDIRLPGD